MESLDPWSSEQMDWGGETIVWEAGAILSQCRKILEDLYWTRGMWSFVLLIYSLGGIWLWHHILNSQRWQLWNMFWSHYFSIMYQPPRFYICVWEAYFYRVCPCILYVLFCLFLDSQFHLYLGTSKFDKDVSGTCRSPHIAPDNRCWRKHLEVSTCLKNITLFRFQGLIVFFLFTNWCTSALS